MLHVRRPSLSSPFSVCDSGLRWFLTVLCFGLTIAACPQPKTPSAKAQPGSDDSSSRTGKAISGVHGFGGAVSVVKQLPSGGENLSQKEAVLVLQTAWSADASISDTPVWVELRPVGEKASSPPTQVGRLGQGMGILPGRYRAQRTSVRCLG